MLGKTGYWISVGRIGRKSWYVVDGSVATNHFKAGSEFMESAMDIHIGILSMHFLGFIFFRESNKDCM